MSKLVDIGDLCTSCHESTAFGSGRFVNRIPSIGAMDDDGYSESGWMCEECQSEPCDRCGELSAGLWQLQDDEFVCGDCITDEEMEAV